MVAVGTVDQLRAGGVVQLVVDAPNAGPDWADALPGVSLRGWEGNKIVLELESGADDQLVLRTALATGRCGSSPAPGIPRRALPQRGQCRAGGSVTAPDVRLSAVQAVQLVAFREVITRLRSKAFRISTAVTLLLLIGFAIVMKLVSGGADSTVGIRGRAPRWRRRSRPAPGRSG